MATFLQTFPVKDKEQVRQKEKKKKLSAKNEEYCCKAAVRVQTVLAKV